MLTLEEKALNLYNSDFLCPYCGNVRAANSFKNLNKEEFPMCYKCSRREKWFYIWPWILWLLMIIGSAILGIYTGPKEWWLVAFGGALATATPCVILFFIVLVITEYTPWRVSLTKSRRRRLRDLKKSDGTPVYWNPQNYTFRN